MTDRINDRLDAITARANAATEGPWEAHTDRFQDESHRDVEGSWIPGVAEKDFYDGDKPALSMLDAEDAEFIASARTDVPTLVAAHRAILALIDEWTPSLAPGEAVDEATAVRYECAQDACAAIAAALGQDTP